MFAQVWVNDIDTGLVVEFSRNGDDLLASGDDLRALGIDAAAGAAPVPLRGITGLTYGIDQGTQTIRILAATSAMRHVEIEPAMLQAESLSPAWGGLLNYSLYTDDSGAGGASGELRLFGPVGTFSSGVFTRRGAGQGGVTVRRLDVKFVLDSAQRLRRLIIGDFIAPDGSSDGAVRAGGIQLASDFTLQPDLVTAPMPHVSGDNGVPSTIDLYVNGVRRLTENVGAGRFTVSGVPMVDGAGQVSLLVRDVLGRESVQQISFYGSRELLRPGLTASSAQAGMLRSNAYERHDRYGAAFVSGIARRGLSDWMTGEARLALAKAVQVAGAGLSTKLGEFGLGSISGDFSHTDRGNGAQASVSFRRDARTMSVFMAAQKTFGQFETLASRQTSLQGWKLQAGGSWQSPTLGGFSLSATALHAGRVTTRILATSWSRPIGRRLSAFANFVETRAGRSAFFASVGLTIVLSPRSTASIQAGYDQKASGAASWSRYGGSDRGTDLRAGISTMTSNSSMLGGVTFRGGSGQIGADVQIRERGIAGRAFASGAAVWLGGRPELSAAVGQSFAMVQTGLSDVAVFVENRSAGYTRSDGSLFIPDLPANATAKIALDYDGIDLNHDAARAEMMIRTLGSGGAIVRMPVHAVQAATIQIVTLDGKPVSLGSSVRRPNGREDVVGYDGVAYLTDVGENVSAEVHDGDRRCRINFARAAHGPIVCYPF